MYMYTVLNESLQRSTDKNLIRARLRNSHEHSVRMKPIAVNARMTTRSWITIRVYYWKLGNNAHQRQSMFTDCQEVEIK